MTFSSRTSQRSSPRFARLILARRAIGRAGEGAVAAAAAAPLGDDDLFLRRLQIAQHVPPVAVENDRPRRHGDDQVFCRCGRCSWPPPGRPLSACQCLRWVRAGQAVRARHGPQDDVPAVAAVAAGGPAARLVLFAPKREAAAAAVPALDERW